MAGWPELREVLAAMVAEQPGVLRRWPDHHYEQAPEPPPFQITLGATAVAAAEDLHRQFGDSALLTVGCLPYPPGRQPDRPLRTSRLTEELLDGNEARVELDGAATVRSGETLLHGLLLRSLTDRTLTIWTNGQVTAVILDPQTNAVIGGFGGMQTLRGVSFRVPPRDTTRIPLLIGTDSFTPELGYTVPAGQWEMEARITIKRDLHTHEDRRTPVLGLTVTA